MQTIRELKATFPQIGKLEWIGIAKKRRGEIVPLDEIEVELKTGLAGDHHAQNGNSKRQVTLIQKEHLPVVAAVCGREEIRADQLRRNLLISGINLLGLKDARFSIGDVLLEGTGPCVPCSYMEYQLGAGGYNAMRGHGGICAIVIEPGTIRIGDEVKFVESQRPDEED